MTIVADRRPPPFEQDAFMHTVDPAEETVHATDARKGVVDLFRVMIAEAETDWAKTHAGAQDGRAPVANLGQFVDRLDERAFGVLIMLFALPCIPPFIYVLPQIMAVPLLALGGQMAAGRQSPWMPEKFRGREFPTGELTRVLNFSERYVRWIEAIARPRLHAVTDRMGVRIVGALMIIPAISIMVPMVGTNSVPSLGIAVSALGLIQRDGLLTIAGLIIAVGWVILLVIFAVFFGVEFAGFIKDMLLK